MNIHECENGIFMEFEQGEHHYDGLRGGKDV